MTHDQTPIAGCMRWGKWGANFSTNQYRQMIDACLAQGIQTFDHADIYGHYTTEAEFGTALKEVPSLRQQLKIITKCGIQMMSDNRQSHHIKSYNTTEQFIIGSVEQSLRNFHTEYIDVLLIHRPSPLLNPHEVASAITKLQEQGKILAFGVSNFLPHQVDMLLKYIPISVNQIEVSIVELAAINNGSLDNCLQHDIIPMAWSPLGGGSIVDHSTNDRFKNITATAKALADQYQTTINQIFIAWLLALPAKVIPVMGTSKIDRLMEAKSASTITLQQEDWFKLYAASTGQEVA